MYFLIIVILSGYSGTTNSSVEHIPFVTREACMTAGALVMKTLEPTTSDAYTMCVREE